MQHTQDGTMEKKVILETSSRPKKAVLTQIERMMKNKRLMTYYVGSGLGSEVRATVKRRLTIQNLRTCNVGFITLLIRSPASTTVKRSLSSALPILYPHRSKRATISLKHPWISPTIITSRCQARSKMHIQLDENVCSRKNQPYGMPHLLMVKCGGYYRAIQL